MSDTSQLLPGAQLAKGASLRSPSGEYRLELQDDGEIVHLISTSGSDAHQLWAAGTTNAAVSFLVLRPSGLLELVAEDDTVCWTAGTESDCVAHLSVADDGVVAIWDANNSMLWSTTITLAVLHAVDDDEAAKRQSIVVEEGGRRSDLRREATVSLRDARRHEDMRMRREDKQHFLDDRNSILDHWDAIQGARCGAISFSVLRAENVGGSISMFVNPYCVVSYGSNVEVESEVQFRESCPEFRFTTFFVVEDDTQPVIVTIMDHAVALSSDIGIGVMLGSTAIDLRGGYPNLSKSAPDGVYTEKCSVIQPLYGSNGKRFDDMTVTVEWSLELREANRVVFCDDCGRLDIKCQCPPEDRQARREAVAQERKAKYLREVAAKSVRLIQEQEVVDRAQVATSASRVRQLLDAQFFSRRDAIIAQRRQTKLGGRAHEGDAVLVPSLVMPSASGTVDEADVDPVDLHQHDDANLRKVRPAVRTEGQPAPKQDSGSCCIVA